MKHPNRMMDTTSHTQHVNTVHFVSMVSKRDRTRNREEVCLDRLREIQIGKTIGEIQIRYLIVLCLFRTQDMVYNFTVNRNDRLPIISSVLTEVCT
jgi:hypothetical protein